MAPRKCRECGMVHEFPRYQATPSTNLGDSLEWRREARMIGCGLLGFVALVAFLWAMFLLWPA